MTEAHEVNDLDGPHEGPIKTPRQLILAVFWAFVVPIFAIVLLVLYVVADRQPAPGTDAFTPEATAARIRPVGSVEVKDATDIASLKTGEQVYTAQCAACHANGQLNAPKLGDTAQWAARIRQGLEALVQASLKGKGQMPPQGGGDHTDFEIARAVVYLANKGGASFAEPQPPQATAAASGAAVAGGATAVAAAAPTAAAPRGEPNAGTPEMTPGANLNTQVQSSPVNAPPAPTTQAPAAAGTTAAGPPAAVGTTVVAAAGGGAAPALYGQICAACHIAGVANAPKLGDKAAWAPRLALGIDGLTASVVKGKGAMPPRGGSAASDADLRAVVQYMVGTVR